MDALDALILGVVQGLTEFLPVSSSGHLELVKALLGENAVPDDSMLFTVILHFATALSTVVIFRKDIIEIFKGLFQRKWNADKEFSLKVVISMIPAALIGFFLNDQLEALFEGRIVFVGCMLIITAGLLRLADKAKNTTKKVSYKNSIVIGVAQAIALLPGISRSGATISTSVILGNDKTKAARFSFLMVVPLILGKIGKDLLSGDLNTIENFTPLGIGFASAFLAGLFACKWMITLVRKSKLTYFSVYCFVVGLLAIILPLLNI